MEISKIDVFLDLLMTDDGVVKWLLWIGVALGFSFLVWVLTLFASTPKYSLKSPLTKSEQRFFLALEKAVPEFYIFPQVGFSAFLEPPATSDRMRYFAKISQKRCDYLICDDNFQPQLIVELDDWSHTDVAKDEARDAIGASAGLMTLRVRWKTGSSIELLRENILSSLRH